MASNRKVAIVTGSNKGIGLEIVKGLCKKFDGDVFLTARNEENGKKALAELDKLGLHPKFYQLDILDLDQINKFANFLKENYGGVDILVNNAAVNYGRQEGFSKEKFVNDVIRTNFTATLNVSNAILPLLRSNARVVHVSSRLGMLNQIKSNDLKNKFKDPNLTLDGLIKLIDDYLEACNNDKDKELGYPQTNFSSYTMSKVGVNALTRIQQKMIDADSSRAGIIISSVCPGYCRTDLTKGSGLLSAAQGSETPVYLCLLPDDFAGPKGYFWAENKPIDWENGGMLSSGLPILKKYVTSFFKH